MCDPVSMSLAAVNGAQSIATFAQKSSAVKKQNKRDLERFEQESALIEADAARNRTALSRRNLELAEIAQDDLDDIASSTVRSLGAARVEAFGVAGNAVAAMFRDVEAQGITASDSIRRKRSYERSQNFDDRAALEDSRYARLVSARPTLQAKPSLLNLGLDLAGSALGGFNNARSAERSGGQDSRTP